jgi:hypothetical protein
MAKESTLTACPPQGQAVPIRGSGHPCSRFGPHPLGPVATPPGRGRHPRLQGAPTPTQCVHGTPRQVARGPRARLACPGDRYGSEPSDVSPTRAPAQPYPRGFPPHPPCRAPRPVHQAAHPHLRSGHPPGPRRGTPGCQARHARRKVATPPHLESAYPE